MLLSLYQGVNVLNRRLKGVHRQNESLLERGTNVNHSFYPLMGATVLLQLNWKFSFRLL